MVILAVSAWILLARKSPAEETAPVAAETRDVASKSVEPETKPAADHAPLAADTAVEDDDNEVAHSNSTSKPKRKRVEMRVIYGTTTVTQYQDPILFPGYLSNWYNCLASMKESLTAQGAYLLFICKPVTITESSVAFSQKKNSHHLACAAASEFY